MKYKAHIAWYLAIVCILAVISGNTRLIAEGEEGGSSLPVDIVGDVTYASRYYWRGADLSNGVDAFLQPSIDVSYTTESESSSFTIGTNVWYSQGVEGAGGRDNSEIDYTVYVGVSAGPVDISAGVIDYVIPNDFPFADGHVLEGNIGVGINSLPFDNSVTVYLNLDGDDDDSIYLAPSVGHTYKNLSFGLTAGIALGESAYYGTDGTKLIDITPSVSYSTPGDAETAISFNIGYNPDTHLKVPYITISTSFSIN